jgi:hypothetical protein
MLGVTLPGSIITCELDKLIAKFMHLYRTRSVYNILSLFVCTFYLYVNYFCLPMFMVNDVEEKQNCNCCWNRISDAPALFHGPAVHCIFVFSQEFKIKTFFRNGVHVGIWLRAIFWVPLPTFLPLPSKRSGKPACTSFLTMSGLQKVEKSQDEYASARDGSSGSARSHNTQSRNENIIYSSTSWNIYSIKI